eukprot:4515-Heterococcus_DN1.PRE.1
MEDAFLRLHARSHPQQQQQQQQQHNLHHFSIHEELSVECNASDSNCGGALSTEDDTVNMNNYDNHNSDRAYYHGDVDADSMSSGGGRVSTGSGGG